MIISGAKQLFEAVKQTAAGLEELGMKDDADRLRAALSISTLPGEILGEIRLALLRIDIKALPKKIEDEIARERSYIDEVLG